MNVDMRPSIARTARAVTERTFRSHDGTELFFRHWPAARPGGGRIVLLHRGHEHGGRMAHLVEETGLDEFAFYAWDARGHGRSEGERGAAPDFATLVRDLDVFVRYLGEADGVAIQDIALVAQSVGAVLAATWVHDYAPGIRAMVLAAPAFNVKLHVPLARPALGLWHRIRGDFRVQSYVKPQMLTRDPARAASYMSDPLVTRAISAGVLLDLHTTSERLVADARAILVPTQLLVSGADWVVGQTPQHRFFVNLGSATKERHVLDGFHHDTFGEKRREPVIAAIRRFISDRFAEPPSPPSLLQADRTGYTRDEADALGSPVPRWTAAAAFWGATRVSVALGAKLSRGLTLGRETGFDSGATLDYVYRDTAEGRGPLGRAIDRAYLNSVGWRGIRVRKGHIEELVDTALCRLAREGQPVRLVDVAAGHGRYILDAVARTETPVEAILLRDFSAENVTAGRRLIAERQLDALARFEQGDAFDEDGLALLDPRPTLAVVSGLYELFEANEPVRRSLAGLARAVPAGGYLVYTCQPWHPQLELIARTLISHRGGQPWVMRRRTQAEMDQLVAATGFRKIEQRIDRWGIFTASLARRNHR